jgi:hypothetical protein
MEVSCRPTIDCGGGASIILLTQTSWYCKLVRELSKGGMPKPLIGETNMDQVEKMLDRPKTYYNIDGVGELGIGFMLLAFSLLGTMQLHAPEGSGWHSMYLFIIYVGLMFLIIKYGSQAIKKHITYPRTGFVEYRKRDATWRPMILGALLAPLTLGLIIVLVRLHWKPATPGPLFGLILAVGYGFRIGRTVRWKWLVSLAMAFASVLIAAFPQIWLDPSWRGAYWLTFMVYGALFLISGGISFWLYLRHTQVPAQENQ